MFGWEDVLDFWFGELDEHGLPDSDHRNRWFRSSRSFDQEIRRRFLSLVLFASEGGLQHWRQEPGGALAEIILLDQFTRNIYRGTELAFSEDRHAVKLCRQALDKGQDKALPPVQRGFLYMPLQHSEKVEDQALSVACYQQLRDSTTGVVGEFMQSFLDSARDHQTVINRFGRFPHRNTALKRTSTEEEQLYLRSGKRYGQ